MQALYPSGSGSILCRLYFTLTVHMAGCCSGALILYRYDLLALTLSCEMYAATLVLSGKGPYSSKVGVRCAVRPEV